MLLLDTHILLWWLADDPKLSQKARNAISEELSIFVSAVSLWEIVIKQSLGKLRIPDNFFEVLKKENFNELPVSFEHAWQVGSLPSLHTDPFDRLLIAQTLVEKLTFITSDSLIPQYNIPCLRV